MKLTGDRLRLTPDGRRTNFTRILILVALIVGGLLLVRGVQAGQVEPLFQPTPTPTRTAFSFYEEAQTHFSAGNLGRAIEAYESAVEVQEEDPRLWAELARVQTYFSSLQPNAARRDTQMAAARQSIERAIELNPDDPFANGIRALVYDWSAVAYLSDNPDLYDEYLKEATESAEAAQRLDPNDILIRALKAEVLLDSQNWAQANDLAAQAALEASNDPTYPYSLDVYRVYGQVLETGGAYNAAILEYRKAVELNPNLTFLYLQIGANYRRLRDVNNALENFDRAARINEQNDVQDPIPFLAIGRTYLQEGEFFVAARNVERAVAVDPGNPELYGFLGVVYHRARNYESAVEVFRCAIDGCTAEESANLLCDQMRVLLCEDSVERGQYGALVPGLPLSSRSVEYYYTYSSVLAFQDLCPSAESIFQQLMQQYGTDPIVSGIVEENRALCSGDLAPPAPAQPEETPPPGSAPGQNS